MSNSEAQATQPSQPLATLDAAEAPQVAATKSTKSILTEPRVLWEKYQRLLHKNFPKENFTTRVRILCDANARPQSLPEDVSDVNEWIMFKAHVRHGEPLSFFDMNHNLKFFALNCDRMVIINTINEAHQSTVLFLNVKRDATVHNRKSWSEVPCNVVYESDSEAHDIPENRALQTYTSLPIADQFHLAYVAVPYNVRNNPEANARVAKYMEQAGADPKFVRNTSSGVIFSCNYTDRLVEFCADNHCFVATQDMIAFPSLYKKRTFVARMDEFENVAGKWQLKRTIEEKQAAISKVLRDNRVSAIWPVGQTVRVVLKEDATQENFIALNDDIRQSLGALACMCEGFRPTWQKPKADRPAFKPTAKAKETDMLIEVHPVKRPVYVRQIAHELAAAFGAALQRAELGYITLRCESKLQRDNMESMLLIHRGIPFIATATNYGPLCETAKEALARNIEKRKSLADPAQQGQAAQQQQ